MSYTKHKTAQGSGQTDPQKVAYFKQEHSDLSLDELCAMYENAYDPNEKEAILQLINEDMEP